MKYNICVPHTKSFCRITAAFFCALFSAGSVMGQQVVRQQAQPVVREVAQQTDEVLLKSLKIDAAQNLNRLKAFKEEGDINKVFDEEREKALGEFLEDQEKWDLLRERGLRDYKKEKKLRTPGLKSAEYLEYLDEKESEAAIYERNRRIQVNVRDQVQGLIKSQKVGNLELEELGLANKRPRYSLRDRANNKWVSAGGRGGSSGFSGASIGGNSYTPPAPPPTSDFAPAVDFPTPPPAFETFDEVQPATPPPVFDSSQGITPFDGQDMNIPPPPPPPDFDF